MLFLFPTLTPTASQQSENVNEENLKLIEALFANADKENQGSELLLWSVREIMNGELVLQGQVEQQTIIPQVDNLS